MAPKEHGSWSLAFEPLALALLVAPSLPGALFALSLAAGFFARRPLKAAFSERRPERRADSRRALAGCLALALLAFGAAIALGGTAWLRWLAPMVAAGGVFAYFDVRGAGREEAAEIAGSAAFALAPAAFAGLAGWTPLAAIGLAIVMLGRAVPSVLCVRAFLRAGKTGVRRDAPALAAALVALTAAAVLAFNGAVPFFAVVALTALAVRAFALLVVLRPTWRARSIGMLEAILGLLFVLSLAAAWNA